MREEFQGACQRFAGLGRRVLGFCYKDFDAAPEADFEAEDSFPMEGLVFLGLVAIMDPPRDGVRDAIAKCHTASIKIFMVTGDHPLTAEAIAKQVRVFGLGNLDGEGGRFIAAGHTPRE